MRKTLTVGSLISGRPTENRTLNAPLHAEAPLVPAHVPGRRPPISSPSRPSTGNTVVRVKQWDQEFSIRFASCQTLLQAAQEQGQSLAYKCQQGYCGKCSVQLLSGSSLFDSPTEQERKKLGGKLPQGYRLACQTAFRSKIHV